MCLLELLLEQLPAADRNKVDESSESESEQ